ncbi:MAG: CDP-alcohol phosphatidyltransferase family protein [Arachnia sp.]
MAQQPRTPLIPRTAPWGEVHAALVSAQKSNRNAPAYSRWINRPLGRIFAATAYRLGLSPNAISVISAAFTFAGIILLALRPDTVLTGILVALLLVLGYALDSSDGQVARLQGGGSLAGEWLDHMFDAVKNGTIHLAVAIFWFGHLGDWSVTTTLIPLAFGATTTVWFFGILLSDLLLRGAGVKRQVSAQDEGKQPIWTSLLGIPVDYGFLCLSMVLLGWFDVWRWLYVLLLIANVAILLLQSVRWYRRMVDASNAV